MLHSETAGHVLKQCFYTARKMNTHSIRTESWGAGLQTGEAEEYENGTGKGKWGGGSVFQCRTKIGHTNEKGGRQIGGGGSVFQMPNENRAPDGPSAGHRWTGEAPEARAEAPLHLSQPTHNVGTAGWRPGGPDARSGSGSHFIWCCTKPGGGSG